MKQLKRKSNTDTYRNRTIYTRGKQKINDLPPLGSISRRLCPSSGITDLASEVVYNCAKSLCHNR
jgi:hypothetical protein